MVMDQAALNHCLSRVEAYRNADRERLDMITALIQEYKHLQIEYMRKCDDYNNEVESRRMWQDKEKLARREVVESRHARESNPFVFVAIDGDGAVFEDVFLKAGADGGAEAAQQLHAKIQSHIAELYPDASTQDWGIVVQVILNVEGLAKKLQSCGIISSIAELYAFGRSFTRVQPMFSFIDIGYGKEQADHKIRENLRFMVRINQCKHILFGPCHDNGYLPVLEEYKRNTSVASRLSLISSTTPGPGFIQLGFKITSYEGIFRSTELVSLPIRTQLSQSKPPAAAAAAAPAAQAKPATQTKPPSPPASSVPMPSPVTSVNSPYAKVSANTQAKTITIASKKVAPRKFYLVNSYDERIDAELPRIDHKAEQRYYDRVKELGHNYCNREQLVGDCPNGEYCSYEHANNLTPGEILVLRHKARGMKCTIGSYCEDAECPYSHHCKMGNKCNNSSCRYADTHHVDLRPVARILEDGTRVPIPSK